MSLKTILLLGIPLAIAGALASSKARAAAGTGNGGGGNGTGNAGHVPPGSQGFNWPPPAPASVPGGSWLASLDEAYTPARETKILDAVAGGLAEWSWYNIESPGEGPYAGWSLQIPVMADALKVEGVRVTGNYQTGQALADRNGWLLFTPYVAGLVWKNADAKLTPTTSQELTNKGVTATTSQMIDASSVVDRKLSVIKTPRDVQGYDTLVGNPGKNWVLTRQYADGGTHKNGTPHIDAGANHGLFTSDWKPIQNVGMAHALGHVDYSQTLRFIGPQSMLVAPDGTGVPKSNAEILMDPELAHMLTGRKNKIYGHQAGEGALSYNRHPRLPASGTYV